MTAELTYRVMLIVFVIVVVAQAQSSPAERPFENFKLNNTDETFAYDILSCDHSPLKYMKLSVFVVQIIMINGLSHTEQTFSLSMQLSYR